MGSDNTKDSKIINNIMDKMSQRAQWITRFITISGVIINAIMYYFNYTYSRKAEEFYRIPYNYFIDIIIDEKIIVFVFMIASLAIMFSPFIIRILPGVNKFDIFESIIIQF